MFLALATCCTRDDSLGFEDCRFATHLLNSKLLFQLFCKDVPVRPERQRPEAGPRTVRGGRGCFAPPSWGLEKQSGRRWNWLGNSRPASQGLTILFVHVVSRKCTRPMFSLARDAVYCRPLFFVTLDKFNLHFQHSWASGRLRMPRLKKSCSCSRVQMCNLES